VGVTESTNPKSRARKRRIFHMAMRQIVEPLMHVARNGILLKAADGVMRSCHPVLGMYIADYPEQVLLTCIKTKCCAICMALQGDVALGNGVLYPSRRTAETQNLRDQYSSQDLWQKYGFAEELPFTSGWFLSDIHESIAPDLLHQIMKGMLKHVMDWVGDLLKQKGWTKEIIVIELDNRFMQIPSWPGLKKFTDGISGVQQWQGSEIRQMMRIYLGIIQGLVSSDVVRAVRSFIDFTYMAECKSHSDDTVGYMEGFLDQFLSRKTALRPGENLWGYIKLHMLNHYGYHVKEKGTIDGSDSSHMESKHKEDAKLPFRASNQVDPIFQMLRLVDRRWKIAQKQRWLDAQAETKELMERPLGNSFAKKPSATYKSIHIFIQSRSNLLPELGDKLHDYLYEFEVSTFPASSTNILRATHSLQTIRSRVAVFRAMHCLYFPMHYDTVSKVSPGKCKDIVRCTSTDLKIGQEDFVLVYTANKDAMAEGMDGKRIAQVRLLFTIDYWSTTSRQMCKLELAYVDWFQLVGTTPHSDNGMFEVAKKMKMTRKSSVGDYSLRNTPTLRDSSIINIDDILRGVHLIPKFGKGPISRRPINTVLQETTHYYVNSYIDHHMYNVMYDPRVPIPYSVRQQRLSQAR
jgi:hypothetical protein